MNESQIVVSVICAAYNHEKYIVDTIEGFVMQKTTFPIEFIIHDDASTDKTADIIRDYEKRYPKIIKPIYQTVNGYGTGRNTKAIMAAVRGKYIAWCEGDDYWTDPLKLQKQVDFLEANEDYSLCFHNALIMWDDKSRDPRYFCAKDQKQTSSVEDVIKEWFIPSQSMMFRSEYIKPLPKFFEGIYNGDWALHMLLADKGKIGYIDKVMSVYRKNDGSLSATMKSDYIYDQLVILLKKFNNYTKNKYDKIISERIEDLLQKAHRKKMISKIHLIVGDKLWNRSLRIYRNWN